MEDWAAFRHVVETLPISVFFIHLILMVFVLAATSLRAFLSWGSPSPASLVADATSKVVSDLWPSTAEKITDEVADPYLLALSIRHLEAKRSIIKDEELKRHAERVEANYKPPPRAHEESDFP